METQYYTGVTSYFINAPVGDAAIHLLWTKRPSDETNVKPTVRRAILLDGGKATTEFPKWRQKIDFRTLNVHRNIHAAIQDIEDHFVCQGHDGAQLKFDAFVVTHWDHDHYQGVMAFLLQDMADSSTAGDEKLSRAIYDNGQPLSSFYAPQWRECERLRPGCGFPEGASTYFLTQDDNSPTLNPGTTMSIRDHQDIWKDDQLRLRVGKDALIGRNLFSREDLADMHREDQSLATFLGHYKTEREALYPDIIGIDASSWPGFYCVGVNGEIVGGEQPFDFWRDYKLSETNMTSICCLLAWVQEDSNDHKVTLFTAGDAHAPMEDEIVRWMGYTKEDQNKIGILKLSHHGAASSTSESLMSLLKPKHVVTMSGNNPKHGHPRWEVVHNMYCEYLLNGSPYFSETPLHLLRYPSYFKNNNQMIDSNPKMEDSFYWGVDLLEEVYNRMKHYMLLTHDLYLIDAMHEAFCPPIVRDIYAALYPPGYEGPGGKEYERSVFRDQTKAVMFKDLIAKSLRDHMFPALVHDFLWSQYYVEKKWTAFTTVRDEDNDQSTIVHFYEAAESRQVAGELNQRWVRMKAEEMLTYYPEDNFADPGFGFDKTINNGGSLSRARRSSNLSASSWELVGFTNDSDQDNEYDSEEEEGHKGLLKNLFVLDEPAFHTLRPQDWMFPSETQPAPPPGTYTLVPRDNAFHGFLRRSPNLRLALVLKPDPDTTPGSGVGSIRVAIHRSDTFQWWMQAMLLVGKTGGPGPNPVTQTVPEMAPMYLEASEWPPKSTTRFDLSMVVDMTLKSGLHVSISVDTNTASQALGVDSAVIDSMMTDSGTIPMGLTLTSRPTTWKLSDVADLIQFPYSKAVAVLHDLPLTPVNPAAARSALWYIPGGSQTTTLRLEFEMDKEACAKMAGWLQATRFELNVHSVRVVAHRVLYFSGGRKAATKPARAPFTGQDGALDKPSNPDARLNSTSAALVRGEMTFEITVDIAGYTFSLYVTISHDAVTFRLQRDAQTQGEGEFSQILRWAARALGNRDGSKGDDKYATSDWATCETWVNSAASLLSGVRPRVIEFRLGYDQAGKLQGISMASVTLQVELKVGSSASSTVDKNQVVFLINFRWGKAAGLAFDGELWTKPRQVAGHIDFSLAKPLYEKRFDIKPTDPDSTIDQVDLKKLLGVNSFPSGVPSLITNAKISVDGEKMVIEGGLMCDYDGTKPSQIPMLMLGSLNVTLTRVWGTKDENSPAYWNAGLEFEIFLMPGGQDEELTENASSKNRPCVIRGGLFYTSARKAAANTSSWTLTATIDALKVSHLAQFWPKGEVRDAVMVMLSHIELEHLGLTYNYGPGDGDGGSDFSFDGVLKLGGLKLSLDFHCDKAQGWEFGAKLMVGDSTGDASPTIDTLLTELLGKGNVPDIPGEVLKVPIGRPKSKDEVFSFKCVQVRIKGNTDKGEKDQDFLMFTGSIHISAISLSLIQWRNTSWAKDVPSKRVVKVSLNELPEVTAPIVGKLKQPFEQLVYMWVSDRASAKTKPKILAGKGEKTAGITLAEHQMLSNELLADDMLYFKSETPDPIKIKAEAFVIEAGSHFMVIAKTAKGKTTAVLDYVFGRPKPLPPAGKTFSDCQELMLDGDPETLEKEPAKAPLKKSVGPLSIENIGLTYDAQTKRLGIVLDATFLLGPIGLALVGFGLSVKLAKASSNSIDWTEGYDDTLDKALMTQLPGCNFDATGLGSLPISDPQVTLDGLLVSFERPQLTIAGGFSRTKMDGATYYAGGLIVGFTPWKLMAMGVYGQVPKPKTRAINSREGIELSDDEDVGTLSFDLTNEQAKSSSRETFTMVFVILKVQGPLFSVGFADIAGLTAGVGVNSEIRLPDASTVLDFPFVKPDGAGDGKAGPLDALKAVLFPDGGGVPWFQPREGAFWVAAGLKATAFTMLYADAVLVVTTSPSIQIGIFGVAVLDVPSLVAPFKFAHAELGFAAVLDPEAGTFRFDAQLSPRSFVIHKSCHLTGGMALYAWAKTGDFVMTMGGYHQAFVAPTAYPQPPRLGISWSLSDSLRISGEAYFAITPRMCMGGGKLNATLNLGPLSAWFDAFLDMLINFRPFKFAADGGLAVGVRFTLDLWLVTIRIRAEIKAMLSVLGPPMAGRVHVDFWVFAFDIDFGDRDEALRQGSASVLSLEAFKSLVLKSGGSAAAGIPMPMDWVHVGRKGSRDFPGEEVIEAEESSTEPFLFNCAAGLLPDNDIKDSSISVSPEDLDEKSWMVTMIDDGTEIEDNCWTVKAGELEFSITLAFAASEVNVLDERPQRRTPKISVPIDSKQKEIYALPMRLQDPIKSTVEVKINQEVAHVNPFYAPPEERSEDYWLVKPVLKSVPKNIWGLYDSHSDPALAGNAVSSLLNAPTAPGSLSLVMGLTFQPPLPFLSKDELPKFNIVTDLLQRVTVDGYPFNEVDSEASKLWNPVDRDPEKPKEEWKRIMAAWDTDASEKKAKAALDIWSQKMGWGTDASRTLVGSRPRSLLARYEDLVPAAPRLAAAA